ncbi:MAG TPA: hypothetical protein VEY71_05745 [Chitinophagales bacterium]|nr:hypothetical protein [Chitinophagales bacterium]
MKKFFWIPLAAMLALTACEKEEALLETSGSADRRAKTKLDLNFSGLQRLDNARYEGWIIVNGEAISTGKFNITPSGQMAPHVFNVNSSDLEDATMFVLTIEPQPDVSPAPSGIKILAGTFSGSNATLTVGDPNAIGHDFTGAAGKYLLATPTTATMADEKSGIWYIDNTSGSPMAGLMLPTLPAGWIYEGWTVIDGVVLTSGKFMSPMMADMAAPYSGPLPGPPFPGEDYVMNAPAGLMFPTDLSGDKAVITIEPYPDNSPEPFFLKPLEADIPMSAMEHFSYMMTNVASMFPTGTATR